MFGGVGKLEVEPKTIISTDQKPDKKKLNWCKYYVAIRFDEIYTDVAIIRL
jgi:hypothetical protein